MRSIFLFVVCLLAFAVMPRAGWGQQAQPSCEEQLAQAQTTLMFTRAGRNGTEENAGRVMATLQKQVEMLQHELDALKKTKQSDKEEKPDKDKLP